VTVCERDRERESPSSHILFAETGKGVFSLEHNGMGGGIHSSMCRGCRLPIE